VTWRLDKPFEEDPVVAEGAGSLAARGRDRVGEVVRGVDDPHALATAAGRRLDHQRVADLVAGACHLVASWSTSAASSIPGTSGTPASAIRRLASILSPIASIASGVGPTQVRPASVTALGEGGVLGEEPVAGVDGVGAGALCCLDDRVAAQVALGRGRAAEPDGLVADLDVQRVGVDVGVHGDGADAEVTAGARDADRDLPRFAIRTLLMLVIVSLTSGTRRSPWRHGPRSSGWPTAPCRARGGCHAGR
jgi:hypothetical protein